MAQIPRHVVDAVREHTDIVAVVSRHVRLERRGQRWVGLCPFHQEKSPSFGVSQDKGLYYCFGCQAGGDVFRFLMQLEGLSFFEAVKELAEAAGVPLPKRELTAEERRAYRQKATHYEVLEAAAGYYESVLWTRSEGSPAREYLRARGIEPEAARKARLGFALPGWSHLIETMRREGFRLEQLIEVGLARPRRQGDGAYDTFRDRLLFPIRDERGRVLAFGGRLLQGDGPKYINSPESDLYEKSKVLYGLEAARPAIQRKNRAILVEGYFDVIALHQAGFHEAVATCGTALTDAHVRKLQRLSRQMLVLTDADDAGAKAAERSLPLLLDAGIQAWRVDLPGAKDPDELLHEQGPEALERALGQGEPLVEWVVDRKLVQCGTDAAGRQRALEELGPLLGRLPSFALGRVAGRLGVPQEALRQRAVPSSTSMPRPQTPDVPNRWRPDRDVVHLLWLVVHRLPQVQPILTAADPILLAEHGPVAPLVARLLVGEPVASVLADTDDPDVHRVLSAITARQHLYEPDQAPIAICEILERMSRPVRDATMITLARTMERSLRQGNADFYREAAAARAELLELKTAFETAIRSRDVDAFRALLDREAALRATLDAS